MSSLADRIVREVASWEGVTVRAAEGGRGVELRLGRHVLGRVPPAGALDERSAIERLREAYESAAAALDRRAGIPA